MKIEEFIARNELENRRYAEKLQNYNKEKEEKIAEIKEYYHNIKINNALNRINEKEYEHENNLKLLNSNLENIRKKKGEEDKQKREKMELERSRKENSFMMNLMEQMDQKERKYEQNRYIIQERKKEKYELVKKQNKEKEEIKKQFEELTTKNRGEIDIEKIKQLFPDDEELHQKLEKTKQEFEKRQNKQIEAYERDKFQRRKNLEKHKRPQSSGKLTMQKTKSSKNNYNNTNKFSNINNPKNTYNASIKSNMSNTKSIKRPKTANMRKNNKTNYEDLIMEDIPKISEKEILNENKITLMIKDYNEKLMRDLLNFFNMERAAENERRDLLNSVKSEIEKKRLEKIFAMQRAQSADKMGEYNKVIDEKLERYEKEWRNVYEKQTNNSI